MALCRLLIFQSDALQQSRLLCGMATNPNDYYVITSRRGEHPDRWSWEIRRKSKRLGIKMVGTVGVTAHPTAEWIANQVTEACGWEQVPRYLIRDRDGAYGEIFIRRLRLMGIRDRPTSPRSPWQNGYAERLIGSIRRECLDHIVVFGERHLRHILLSYMNYHNAVRTHLSLEKDAPVSRAVERAGRILCRPILGGLHHQYARF
jgi:hypothetical protein